MSSKDEISEQLNHWLDGDLQDSTNIDDQYMQMSSSPGYSNSYHPPPRKFAHQSQSVPTAAQRFHNKHTTAEGLISSRSPEDISREHAFVAQSRQEVQPSNVVTANDATVSEALTMNYGQCEMPSVTISGVFEYFQEALSPDSRKLSNEPSNHNIRECTTISAMKEPGKRAGVIFTRLSNEQPNVAIISMIMHDSIFSDHNKSFYGKLEGSVVVAVNGVAVDDARHAARLVILAEGEVSLTIEISPIKTESEVEEEKERIAMGVVEVVQEELSDINADISQEGLHSVPSTIEESMELEYSGLNPISNVQGVAQQCNDGVSTASSNKIVEMAPLSLRLQLKDRMESRKNSFDPLDQNYSSLMMSSSCSTSETSNAHSSVNSRRMQLFSDRLEEGRSTCSDSSTISRYFDLKRSSSIQSTHAPADCEDDIMTPKKNNINRKHTVAPSSNDDSKNHPSYGSKHTMSKNTKHGSQQLHTNSSSVTSVTADLTYLPSKSYDEESIKTQEFLIDPTASIDEECSIKDLPTPMLLARIENLFGNINNKEPEPAQVPRELVSSSISKNDASSAPPVDSEEIKQTTSASFTTSKNDARANDIFDRIMNKYSTMSFESVIPDTQSSIKSSTQIAAKSSSSSSDIVVSRDCNESLSSGSVERLETNKYFSGLLTQQAMEADSRSVKFMDLMQTNAHMQPSTGALSLHRRMQMMQIELKESIDEDGDEEYIRVGMGEEEDDVSTLSRSTCITVGSASFCSTDTKEINSHVKSLVHSIVQRELKTSGSMKKELEDALHSKARLESRVRKLMRRNNKHQMQLQEANLKNETIVEEIDKEMTIQLTRKAAELKSCVEAALEQAEESKRRAVELTKNSMEHEILTLRSELDEALSNGVQLDSSLQRALALVESNQQTLRLAAESDARETAKMKSEIEQSFVTTVDEFEAWAEKQVIVMERLEKSIMKSGSVNPDDEAKLVKIKHSLELAMNGMCRMQYRMKAREGYV